MNPINIINDGNDPIEMLPVLNLDNQRQPPSPLARRVGGDPLYVRVENVKPTAVALDVIEPVKLVTPVSVPINLIGPKDFDGRIVDYTWWYYDAQVPNKKIDIHVTTEPKTTFTILKRRCHE